MVLADKNAYIEKLERDISEFKRQRDEAREYSAEQYARGAKDLFMALNDARYGKVIDFLYRLLCEGYPDETLTGYLENLFMALQDMDIEPIMEGMSFTAGDSVPLNRKYNLDFDISEYDESRARLKYAGWTYRGSIMERPTLQIIR